MKHVLALLVAGAVLSGVCAYAAIARPAAEASAKAGAARPR